MRGRAAALVVTAGLALAACGGGDEGDEDTGATTTVPTVPTTTTPTTPETSPATPPEASPPPYSTEEQAPGEGDGGAAPAPPAPRGDGRTGGARPPEDSPENDTAPDPDSPAGRYERFCDENPGACE